MHEKERSIAVLSFLPDAGHVFPLLRVAASFQEQGYQCSCYLPEECANYLRGYSFDFVSLGPIMNETFRSNYNRTLSQLSKRSIFYNAFSSYADLAASYWGPLQFRTLDLLPQVRAALARQRPLFLLCDDHVFRSWYVDLSEELKTPLVLHTFEGYRRFQNPYVQAYGISDLSHPQQVIVEKLGAFCGRFFRRLRSSPKVSASREPRAADHRSSPDVRVTENLINNVPSGQPIEVSTGCGYLEQKYLRSKLRIDADAGVFGPLTTKTTSKMPRELRDWIEKTADPVVYISFGSMIAVDFRLVKAILDGLKLLNARVLWSMPKAQQAKILPKLDIPESVVFWDFVPPLSVLTMPQVRCGINHGGAGSIQDCLLTGTPMLCIPYMWDQPFNSSVIERLRIGKRLWKRQVSAQTIAKEVGSILSDSQMALRSSELAQQLRECNSEAGLIEYILSELPFTGSGSGNRSFSALGSGV
jgi:UDP:flavonoid glycosyltransferase YjiC (YdhE family)